MTGGQFARRVVPTRVGQATCSRPPPEQDEYDIPRHLLAPGPQDIYDAPPLASGCCLASAARRWVSGLVAGFRPSPARCCAVQARPGGPGVQLGVHLPALRWPWPLHYCTSPAPQVYDTPPMATWVPMADPRWMCTTCPPVGEQGLLPASHHAVSMEGLLQLHRVLGVTVCALRRGPAEQGLPETCLQTL